jgi:hypothetical protein
MQSSWPWTLNPPTSTSQVLRLQVPTITPGLRPAFLGDLLGQFTQKDHQDRTSQRTARPGSAWGHPSQGASFIVTGIPHLPCVLLSQHLTQVYGIPGPTLWPGLWPLRTCLYLQSSEIRVLLGPQAGKPTPLKEPLPRQRDFAFQFL